jgi:hypothetical protein
VQRGLGPLKLYLGRAHVHAPPGPALQIPAEEEKMAETAAVTKRTEEPSTIRPVRPENLVERVNTIFESIARRAFAIFEDGGYHFGRDLEIG